MIRQQLGQSVYLAVNTVNGSGVDSTPDTAPLMSIYNSAGTAIVTDKKMPPQDFVGKTLFSLSLFLGSDYAEGSYCAYMSYIISGVNYATFIPFDVIGGGNAKGAYTALQFIERPQADYIIGGTESGDIEARRNPRVNGDY